LDGVLSIDDIADANDALDAMAEAQGRYADRKAAKRG
jgi:hypothetical protein